MKLFGMVAATIMIAIAGAFFSPETSAEPKHPTSDVKPAAAAAKVNLNTASQAELEKLPGIGPATAKKIIAGRPYARTEDLAKAGIPAGTINKIMPLVTVRTEPGAQESVKSKASLPAPPKEIPAVPQTVAPSKVAKPATPPPVGKDMVWVNTDSKIYHKQGSRWYGKTKQGNYMTESEAIKAGYRQSGAKDR